MERFRKTWTCSAAMMLLLPVPRAAPQAPTAKSAQGAYGMVATGNPYATAAGVRMLEAGGNAVDAAAAACFTLMVADPAMTSLGGRTQMLVVLRDGSTIGLDGATQAPVGVPPLASPEERRELFQVVPVPGNPAALAHAVSQYGKLPLARVLQPAIELAEKGFTVPPNLATIWNNERERLARDPGARELYLRPDGSAYAQGETFRNPRLARLLRALAQAGPNGFYRGPVAKTLADDVANKGGYIRRSDLETYRPQPATIVRTGYRGYEIVTLGRHAWGNTLVEMLNILSHFELRRGEPPPEEVELLVRVIAQALEDRPQILGSLRPKPDGLSLERISSREFARERAERIREALKQAVPSVSPLPPGAPDEARDTTHISVMDSEGNAVALTTSIGPRFGACVATPELGFLYAHSYRMRSDPTPQERDLTEMTPTIVLRNGRPMLAVGAAGSEQIPGAILQVISNVLDRGYSLERAVQAPRVSWSGRNLRVQTGIPETYVERLRVRGFVRLQTTPGDMQRHLGIVQAVLYDADSGMFVGAADPVYDGSAAGPARPWKERKGAR